jgi:large subunit ribosomal protein L19
MNINSISQTKINPKIPPISPGDTVKVSFKVKEANRERVQTLSGLVVRARKGAAGGNFTVRRVTGGIGVEHTFPFASPSLEKVEVVRHGKVRRAKLYYIRRLSAREARLKERRERMAEKAAALEAAAAAEGEIAEPVAEQGATEENTVEEHAAAEESIEEDAAEEEVEEIKEAE